MPAIVILFRARDRAAWVNIPGGMFMEEDSRLINYGQFSDVKVVFLFRRAPLSVFTQDH